MHADSEIQSIRQIHSKRLAAVPLPSAVRLCLTGAPVWLRGYASVPKPRRSLIKRSVVPVRQSLTALGSGKAAKTLSWFISLSSKTSLECNCSTDRFVYPNPRGIRVHPRPISYLDFAAELLVGRRQILGNDASLADGRDEVGITRPARHDVNVNVIDNSGTRRPAEIHSHIETCRLINFAQSSLTALGQVHEFVGRLLRGGVKFPDMIVGNDQQMSANVGIDIEDDVAVSGSFNYKVFCVSLRIFFYLAKDADGRGVCFTAAGTDVLITPGAPQSFHQRFTSGRSGVVKTSAGDRRYCQANRRPRKATERCAH